tara:strand:+ start:1161 stop:1706 length:546 start_codon:yes stop_codon:yes gene_type:complete
VLFDSIAFLPIFLIGGSLISYKEFTSLNFYEYLDPIGREIMYKVDSSQNVTYWPKENTPGCKSNNGQIWFGYVEYPNILSSADFVICTYNIYGYFGPREFEYQVNSTVRHEAAHSAQFCKGGNYHLGVDKTKFAGYPNERVYGPYSIYRDLPYNQQLMELEAFALESEPYFVSRSLDRFCF